MLNIMKMNLGTKMEIKWTLRSEEYTFSWLANLLHALVS